MARQQASLDRANGEAWGLFGRLQNRFAVDYRLMPDLFRAHIAGWPAEDVVDVLERLTIIYDVLCPPKSEAE